MVQMRLDAFVPNHSDWFEFDWEDVVLTRFGVEIRSMPRFMTLPYGDRLFYFETTRKGGYIRGI